MGRPNSNFLKTFDLKSLRPPVFFQSVQDCQEASKNHPNSHIMRRAWDQMGLSGIYCIENKPTIYFKEVDEIDPDEARKLQSQLWNQGFATLLIISSETEVQIFTGLVPPIRASHENDQNQILVEVLDKTTKVFEIQQLVQRVETGQFYREHKEYFDPAKAVDQYLLRNLSELRDQIKASDKKLDYSTIHAFLGRIIFTCYLVDRKIINSKHFSKAGARNSVGSLKELFNSYESEKARKILSKLFKSLQADFNGSMFDEKIDDKKILPGHIEILRRFFNLENLQSGQLSFDFWSYDFSIIPIETISAIYEEFLAVEEKEVNENGEKKNEKEKLGAYYTPKLLAELTVDIAVEGWSSLLDKKVLDPSCGSGIFLVIIFNRMAEEWRFRNPNKRNITKAKELIKLIQTNLCGVDVKETACRITCFSLYLAFLDQLSPRDIDELKEKHEKVLPNLLALEKKNYKNIKLPVIFQGNFFDPNLPIADDFDLVIGNPPWVGRKRKPEKKAKQWYQSSSNPWLKFAPKNKKDRESIFIPQNQIAHLFAWKVPLHLKTNGRGCKVLPSKLFLNKTDKFQKLWFSEVSVDKVIQVSDLRFILFKNAICPAVITRFSPEKPKDDNFRFDYQIPKVSRIDPRNGVLTLFPENCKKIKLSDIIQHTLKAEASILWKKWFWGTPRDVRLIDRLLEMPGLNEFIGGPKEGKRWIKGQGFIPYKSGKSKTPWWNADHPFINAKSKSINFFLLKEDCEEVKDKFPALYRLPNEKVFKGPLILTNQGFSKFAFCDFDVLFQDSLQSICGPREDEDFLLFLTAVLNSKLATYFLFHTAANWGTERDKVHLFELLRLPFQLPEDTYDPKRSASIIKETSKKIKEVKRQIEKNAFGRDDKIKSLKQITEQLVYDYYDISELERILIEDTINIYEPSSTPSTITTQIPTLIPSTQNIRRDYEGCLRKVINDWAKRSGRKVSGSSTICPKSGLAILSLKNFTNTSPYKEKESSEVLRERLIALKKYLPKKTGQISYFRGLKIFDKEDIHIIKPLDQRHWTKTAALNDADEIATSILQAGRKTN